MSASCTYPFPDVTWEAWHARRREADANVHSGTMQELRQLVHNYNEAQAQACTGIRMDLFNPCNGSPEHLCMQCPRRNGAALVQTPLPG